MFTECDLPECYSYREPVARKQHRCCECSAPIHKGEKHFVAAGKWDGKFSQYRQHYVCMEACMLLRDKFYDGDCIGFGELYDEFEELKQSSWFRRSDSDKPAWRELRTLIAVIKRRERSERCASR